MTTQEKSPYLYLNHPTRKCLGCKRLRSRAQFVGESELCMQCARRGIVPTPSKRDQAKGAV